MGLFLKSSYYRIYADHPWRCNEHEQVGLRDHLDHLDVRSPGVPMVKGLTCRPDSFPL